LKLQKRWVNLLPEIELIAINRKKTKEFYIIIPFANLTTSLTKKLPFPTGLSSKNIILGK